MQQFQFMLLWTMLRFDCIHSDTLRTCFPNCPYPSISVQCWNVFSCTAFEAPQKASITIALRRTHVDGWTNSVHIKSLLLRTDSAAALAVPRSLSSSAIWIALIKLQWQVHMHMLPHRLLCIIMDALHRREVQSFNKHIWRRGTTVEWVNIMIA